MPNQTDDTRFVHLPVDSETVRVHLHKARALRARELRRLVRRLFAIDIYPKGRAGGGATKGVAGRSARA